MDDAHEATGVDTAAAATDHSLPSTKTKQLELKFECAGNGRAQLAVEGASTLWASRVRLGREAAVKVCYKMVYGNWEEWQERRLADLKMEKRGMGKSKSDGEGAIVDDGWFNSRFNRAVSRLIPDDQSGLSIADTSSPSPEEAVATVDARMAQDTSGRTRLHLRFGSAFPESSQGYPFLRVKLGYFGQAEEGEEMSQELQWTDAMEFPLPFESLPKDERIFVEMDVVRFRPFGRDDESPHTHLVVDALVSRVNFDAESMQRTYELQVPSRLVRWYRYRGKDLKQTYEMASFEDGKALIYPMWLTDNKIADLRGAKDMAPMLTSLSGLPPEWSVDAYAAVLESGLVQQCAKEAEQSLQLVVLDIVECCVKPKHKLNVGCPVCFRTSARAKATKLARRRTRRMIGHGDEESGDVAAKGDAYDRLDDGLRPYLTRTTAWKKRLHVASFVEVAQATTTTGLLTSEDAMSRYLRYLSRYRTYCDMCLLEMGRFEANYFCVGEGRNLTHDFCADCVYRSVARFQSLFSLLQAILSEHYDMNHDCVAELVSFVVGVDIICFLLCFFFAVL